jgi:hypothetical protein
VFTTSGPLPNDVRDKEMIDDYSFAESEHETPKYMFEWTYIIKCELPEIK